MSLFRPRRSGSGSPPANRRRHTSSDASAAPSETPDNAQETPARRPLVAVLRTLLFALLVGAIVIGGYYGWYRMTRSSYFSVQHIEILGLQQMRNDEAIAAAGLQTGTNIFAIDLEQIEERLRLEPWVLSVRTGQKLPDTIRIEISERRAAAMVVFEVPYLVDDEGNIFKRWVVGDPQPSVIINGIDKEELQSDPEGVSLALREAMSLAQDYAQAGLSARAPLWEVFREVDGGFSLTVGKDPFYVRLGRGPYREKLSRLRWLLDRVKADKSQPAIIYADNPNRPGRVTVKFRDTEGMP
ncbi:MAG: FtsQ-type POTRA domain-containing protein [Proteobacteria bacterium]|nr:FtsQ-type POTRA domain-containing protein [Pseudomonadota bacterium]